MAVLRCAASGCIFADKSGKFLYGVQNAALGGVASMVQKEILALVVDISISLENKLNINY